MPTNKTSPTPSFLAIPIALLTLVAGCATSPTDAGPVLLTGRHVAAYTKAQAAAIPPLAPQAALCAKYVYVYTDIGLAISLGLTPSLLSTNPSPRGATSASE